MKIATILGGAVVTACLVLVLAERPRSLGPSGGPAGAGTPAAAPTAPAEDPSQGFLYGHVITDGATYEGRLRFGGNEEAFWGDYFNGVKRGNPWAAHVDAERLTRKREPIRILGIQIPLGWSQIDLGRPMMARFGDIARIEARGRDLWVTLKSGTAIDLDRFSADDFADGVRVWDAGRGVVDLKEGPIRSIEFLPTPRLEIATDRLYGTVRTAQGNFTGFIEWDRRASVGADELAGRADSGDLKLRFDTIRSIARRSRDTSLVTLVNGTEVELLDTRPAGQGHRGIYVDDRRYGRVLLPWEVCERVDFSAAGTGPAYTDFPPGGPLTGTVTTRAGRRLTGRLVYDLDESETTETLDAPSGGVNYTIPFALVASIATARDDARAARRARVMLHGGEQLKLECTGDLSDLNAGLLVFVNGQPRPEYVSWSEVEKIDFDRPAMTHYSSGQPIQLPGSLR